MGRRIKPYLVQEVSRPHMAKLQRGIDLAFYCTFLYVLLLVCAGDGMVD